MTKDVVLRLLVMMMESASNTATIRNAKFSLMMQNLNNNATNKSVGFASKVFYF
jgi:hypothetical protein